MGFIDYVVDYFKGPQGDPGAPGATGPAGPSTVHQLSPQPNIVDGTGSGSESFSFTLPEGATLLAYDLDPEVNGSVVIDYSSPWTISRTGEYDYFVNNIVVTDGSGTANARILYYLP